MLGIYFFFGAAFFAGFFAAFLAAGFLAAGFLAAFFGVFAFGFFTFFSAGAFTGSLKEPAPFFPAAAAATIFLLSTIFLRARRTRTAALAASTLLFAMTYLRIAWREEPFLSPRALM